MRSAELSHATALPARSEIHEAWTGQGRVVFHEAKWEQAPLSFNAVNALAALPVETSLGAAVTHGSQDLLISQQHPLE